MTNESSWPDNIPPFEGRIPTRWTPLTRACYASGIDCDNCHVLAAHKRRWLGPDAPMHSKDETLVQGCKAPMAVQAMLDAGMDPVKSYKRNPMDEV